MAPPDEEKEFAAVGMTAFRLAVHGLEATIQELELAWHGLVERADALLRRVERELNSDSLWATIAEWFTDDVAESVARVRSLVKKIGESVTSLLEKMRISVEKSVPVGSLFDRALAWSTQVNPPLSALTPELVGSGKIDSWRGPARITYGTRVADQVEATDVCVSKVSATSRWLADVAAGNTEYMVDLAGLLGPVISALTQLLVDIGESALGAVTQAPFTLQQFSELIGEAVASSLLYQAALVDRLAQSVRQTNDLANEYGDNRGLPGGKWPQAVNV